ncbi:MAG: hypothetical protein DRJ03_30735 [Chloroflexi bacterium]|nr:MAG: hypothetical protein DRJ03_30735 [Chloroflexota bacterium]
MSLQADGQHFSAAYQETARACFFLKEDPWGAGAANNGFHPTRAMRGGNRRPNPHCGWSRGEGSHAESAHAGEADR